MTKKQPPKSTEPEKPKKPLDVEKESVELDDESLDDAAGGVFTKDFRCAIETGDVA